MDEGAAKLTWESKHVASKFFFRLPFIIVCSLGGLLAGMAEAQEGEPAVLKVVLNSEEKGDLIVILLEGGDIFFPMEELMNFGFQQIPEQAIIKDQHVSLRSLAPLVEYKLDVKESTLYLTADPKILQKQVYDLVPEREKSSNLEGSSSIFVNYSFSASASTPTNGEIQFDSVSVPFETGIRMGGFLATSNFTYLNSRSEERLIRLMSNLTKDYPEKMVRVTLGDTYATSGELGAGLLGGVQISKNFSLQPYFLRYPGLNLQGVALSPSEVEIYIGDRLVKRESISPGEFIFSNIPMTVGPGLATIVLRDAFGREQQISSSYFISPELLKPGVQEFSYSLGFKRNNLGQMNFDYGDFAAAGFHRFGLTRSLTGGFRMEIGRNLINSGLTASYILGFLGELDNSFSISRAQDHWGYCWSFSLWNPGRRGVSVGISSRGFSQYFDSVFYSADFSAKPKFEGNATIGLHIGPLGSISGHYSYQERYDGYRITRFSLFFSRSLWKNASLTASASRMRGDTKQDEILVGVNIFLGERNSMYLSGQSAGGQSSASASFQKSPPLGKGIGYRVEAAGSDLSEIKSTNRLSNHLSGNARLEYRGSSGVYMTDYRNATGQNSISFQVAGSLVLIKNRIFLSRPVTDGFALVRVGDVKGVSVSHNNQVIGETNRRGEILVPGLTSYYDNRISIEAENLPLNYSVSDIVSYAAPPYRGGGVLSFAVKKFQSFDGRLVVEDQGKKKALEFAGLEIDVDGKIISCVVGVQGEFYVENLQPGRFAARVLKDNDNYQCIIVVPKSDEISVDLGEVVCEKTKDNS